MKDLGTGLAGRRKEAQGKGAELAPKLKASGYMAIQARERWSLTDHRPSSVGQHCHADTATPAPLRQRRRVSTVPRQHRRASLALPASPCQPRLASLALPASHSLWDLGVYIYMGSRASVSGRSWHLQVSTFY